MASVRKGSPKKHLKTGLAALAAAVLLSAGLVCAYLNGIFIPNQIRARHYEVRGADVSSYQGDIDWQVLAAQDIQFAYIKATEGSGYADPQFQRNWTDAHQTNLAVGAYHFFSYDSAGATQAENFINTVPVLANDLPPAVDVEFYGDKEKNLPEKGSVKQELQTMLDALEAHYGRKPVIYATEKSYRLYIMGEFEDYDLWIRSVVTAPRTDSWTFWQYTDRVKLDGYNGKEQFIDINVFSGTQQEWTELLHTN